MKKLQTYRWALVWAALFWAGCNEFPSEPAFYEQHVPPEKVKTIKPLDLAPYRTEQQPEVPSVLELPQEPTEKLELSLEQCRAQALKNNLDIKVQLLSPLIAQESVNTERAKFEAAFFSNLSYDKTDQPPAADLAIQGSQIDSGYVDMGVRVPLQTGGTITFDLADSRTKGNFESSTFNPSYTEDFSLSISQPLLRNAGIRTNTYSIRIAGYDKAITDARTKLEVNRVIAAMDRVYWRLYAAFKQLEVRKQQYDLAQAQLDRAKRFVKAGQNAQVEIYRAEAGLAQSLESIIIAENNLRDRQRELKLALQQEHLEPTSPTVITPATEPNPMHYTFTAETLISQAIENRMEMLEQELQIAKSVSTIDYLRNQALPLVSLDYTYNINGLGPTHSAAYDLMTRNNFADHRLGLQLVIPLGNEAAESRLRQAFYNRRQALATKENRQTVIEVEVLNVLDQCEANWQRILASRQSALLEERLYQAEIRQFEIGLRTSTDVLQAQANFVNAQSTEINALTEYQIALVDLAYATGTLLGAAQVEWEPASSNLN
ncbi:MAG: TolC family protein [Planctomycetales bacterium]|nr:TolC family protein [Planctomycetales bacterium]